MKEAGMGRARVGRFSLVAVPSAIATAGLGFAMLQGMVGAAISSADGFTLQSNQISADALKVRPGQAQTSDGAGGTGDTETIYAETTSSNADEVHVTASVPLPIGNATMTIDSADANVPLGDVVLNAQTLGVADADSTVEGADATNSAASLNNVNLGIAQDSAGFSTEGQTTESGYVADGFALTSGASDLNNLDATAYAINLSSLNLDDLQLGVSLG